MAQITYRSEYCPSYAAKANVAQVTRREIVVTSASGDQKISSEEKWTTLARNDHQTFATWGSAEPNWCWIGEKIDSAFPRGLLITWRGYIHTCITYIHTCIHYITLHHITSHYITLHYITLRDMTLHHITSHYIYTTLHYITLQYITLHYITLHYVTLH